MMTASLVLFTSISVLLCFMLCLMHEAEKQSQMTVQQQHILGAQPCSVKLALHNISRVYGGVKSWLNDRSQGPVC